MGCFIFVLFWDFLWYFSFHFNELSVLCVECLQWDVLFCWTVIVFRLCYVVQWFCSGCGVWVMNFIGRWLPRVVFFKHANISRTPQLLAKYFASSHPLISMRWQQNLLSWNSSIFNKMLDKVKVFKNYLFSLIMLICPSPYNPKDQPTRNTTIGYILRVLFRECSVAVVFLEMKVSCDRCWLHLADIRFGFCAKLWTVLLG